MTRIRDQYTNLSASNMNFSLVFFLSILSAIYTCHGKTECEDRRVDLILEEMTSLRRWVLALEDTVRRQRDVIDDLTQQNIQQEKRIEETETAWNTKTEKCEKLEHRLEIIESRLKADHAPTPSSNMTTKPIVNGFIPNKERFSRKKRQQLNLNPMATGSPSHEEGVVAFYAQMSSTEVSPGAHHTLIFDRVRTNVGNGYNGITGVFIAPQEGIYAFIWVIRIHDAEHSTELLINNDIFGATFLRAKNGDDGSVSGTAIAHVKKGDIVFVRIHSTYAGDGNVQSNVHGQPTFSGWLLH